MAEAAGAPFPDSGSVPLNNGRGSGGNPSPTNSHSPVKNGSPSASRASLSPESLGSSIVRISDSMSHFAEMTPGMTSVGNLEDMQFSLLNSLSSMNSNEINTMVLDLMSQKNKLQEYVIYLNEQTKVQQELVHKVHSQRQQELSMIEGKNEQARSLVTKLKDQIQVLKSEKEQLEEEKQQLAGAMEAAKKDEAEKMVIDEATSISGGNLPEAAAHVPGTMLDISPSPSVRISNQDGVPTSTSTTVQTEGMELSEPDESPSALDSIQRENIKMKEMITKMKATVEQLQEANTRLGSEKKDLIAINNELSLKVTSFSASSVGYVLVNDGSTDDVMKEICDGSSLPSNQFHFLGHDEEVQTSLEQLGGAGQIEAPEMAECTVQTSIPVVPANEVEEKLQEQNQKIEGLQKTITDQERKISDMAEDLKTHLARLEYAKQVRNGLEKDIEQQKTENKALHAKLEAVSKDLQIAEQARVENITMLKSSSKSPTGDADEISALQQQRDGLAASITRLQQANEDLKRQVTSLVGEMDGKDSEFEALQTKQREESLKLQASQKELSQRMTRFEKERMEKNQTITNLTQELRQLESALKAQAQQKQAKDLDAESLTKEYQDLLHDHHKVIQERERHQQKQQEISKKYAELYQEYEKTKTDQKGFEEQFLGMMDHTQKMQAKLTKCEEENVKLKQEVDIIPALQAQAEVYQADFNAERRSREEAVAKQNEYKDQITGYERNIEALNEIIRQQGGPKRQGGQTQWFTWFGRKGSPGRDEPDREQGQWVDVQAPGPAEGALQPEAHHNLQYNYPYPPQQRAQQQQHQYPQQQPPAEQQQQPQQQQQQQHQRQGTGLQCPQCGDRYPDHDSLQVHLIDCDGM